MPKRILCLSLVILLILSVFSGCSLTPAAPSSPTEIDSTSPTEKPGLEDTPNVVNGVYATCGNYNYVIYSKIKARIVFYLLCAEPLPSNAKITVDTDSDYVATIRDVTPNKVGFGYNPELWCMTEQGVDMAEYYQIYAKYLKAQDAFSTGQITREEYDTIVAAWSKFQTEYYMPALTAYSAFRDTPCPYYYYEVDLRVSRTGNEVLTRVRLEAGDMSREISLGRIELRYEEAPLSAGSGAEFVNLKQSSTVFPNLNELSQQLNRAGRLCGALNDPWCPYSLYTGFKFVAKEDITFTDLYFLDDGTDTLHVTAMEYIIVGKNGNVQLTWEPGSSPVLIRKGEAVMGRVYYDSPYFRHAECHVSGHLVMEYTDANGGGRLCTAIDAFRKRPCLELYQWAFEKLDTKSFYVDAYYKYYVTDILRR